MEWTVTIEGQDKYGEVQRAELRIEKGLDRLTKGEIGLALRPAARRTIDLTRKHRNGRGERDIYSIEVVGVVLSVELRRRNGAVGEPVYTLQWHKLRMFERLKTQR